MSKKKAVWARFVLILSVMLITVDMPDIVHATPIASGNPIEGNSWTQLWWSVDSDLMTKMEAFIVANSSGVNVDFESPGLSNFIHGDTLNPISGWSSSLINPDYSLATGPAPNDDFISWATTFSGNSTDSQYFSIDFLTYVGESELYSAFRFTRNGTGWSSLEGEWLDLSNLPDYNRAPVPEPATMLLLGSGLVGVIAYGRKKFFKNSAYISNA